MIKMQRFDVSKGRELIEWLISMDDPDDEAGMEARRTVTLNNIIVKARECLSDPPKHIYMHSPDHSGLCVNAHAWYRNSWCGLPKDNPIHEGF